ncbi:MAG: hypothetical protein VYA34_06210 [Myxococcota bacterium]|nr:hypothetical protein [Myxococcota bacterium]
MKQRSWIYTLWLGVAFCMGVAGSQYVREKPPNSHRIERPHITSPTPNDKPRKRPLRYLKKYSIG